MSEIERHYCQETTDGGEFIDVEHVRFADHERVVRERDEKIAELEHEIEKRKEWSANEGAIAASNLLRAERAEAENARLRAELERERAKGEGDAVRMVVAIMRALALRRIEIPKALLLDDGGFVLERYELIDPPSIEFRMRAEAAP